MKPEESDKHQPAIGHKIPRLNVWQRTSRMGLFFNLNGEILYNKEIRIKPKIHITKPWFIVKENNKQIDDKNIKNMKEFFDEISFRTNKLKDLRGFFLSKSK